jgi:hypothetical protein
VKSSWDIAKVSTRGSSTKRKGIMDKKTYSLKKIIVAELPWAIIVAIAITFAGVWTGWVMRSNDLARLSAARAEGAATVQVESK